MSGKRLAPAVVLALLWQSAAYAASDDDLAKIRKEIGELKANYEARIQALEQRLKDAESRAAAAPLAAVAPEPAVAPAQAGAQSSQTAFNPAISAILAGRYANLSKDPRGFIIPGFSPGGEIGPGPRGFSLGESELVFSANVDPLFAGNLTLSITPENTVEVEEAYGLFKASNGLAPKVGRFLSGVGYLNEQHAHAWDFVDAPLAYQAFFGGQYRTDGLQVKWVAPTDTFIELGGEVGNDNAYPGTGREKNGVGSGAAYAHAGGDVGDSNSWRAGASWLESGDSKVAVADFVWKWSPHGNIRERYVKIQGEYLAGKIRDDVRQNGWYLQSVWQFLPEWRVGARYDRLDPNGVDDASYAPRKASVMLDWNPSEFSRIRLQFARAQMLADVTDNQWFVQYILSLGAHGAHKY